MEDTWNEEYWSVYELIREGYQKVKITQSDKLKSGPEIAGQIADVQDLALNMNKNTLGTSNEGKKVLMEIDELSKQHMNSTLAASEYEIVDRKCCKTCVVC